MKWRTPRKSRKPSIVDTVPTAAEAKKAHMETYRATRKEHELRKGVVGTVPKLKPTAECKDVVKIPEGLDWHVLNNDK